MLFFSKTAKVFATVCSLSLLSIHTAEVRGQYFSYCDGEVGEANWTCDVLAPVPAQVSDGRYEFLPLPGSPDPANPVIYKQIAGKPAFGASGRRNDNPAVFVLHEGAYFCMLAESNGEAALFDAPEGSFVSSSGVYPTGSWLGESVKALLGDGTKLKYIVYTRSLGSHGCRRIRGGILRR